MEDLTNILYGDEQWSDEQLLKYLEGNLSKEELHAVEKQIADSSFIHDAVEGLQSFSPGKKPDEYVAQLNKHLQSQLAEKKQRRQKRKINNLNSGIIAVIIILLLCILGYVVIRLAIHGH